MGALVALHYQFNIIYLGPNLPVESLIDAVRFLDAKLIVVGATEIVAKFGNNYIQNYLEKLCDKTNSEIQIAIGTSLSFEISNTYKRRVKHFKNLEDFDSYLSKLI
jgi:methanogenic corrinoid protein MtbC1